MELKYICNFLIYILLINYSCTDNKKILFEKQNDQQQTDTTELQTQINQLETECSNLTQTIQQNEVLIAKNLMYIIILIAIVSVLFIIIFVYFVIKIQSTCSRKKEDNDLLKTIIAEFDNSKSSILKNSNNEDAEYSHSETTRRKIKTETINPDAFIADPSDQKLYRPYSANEIN